MSTSCPLCAAHAVSLPSHHHGRRYLECSVCRLTFVHPEDYLSPKDEAAHYATHENDAADPRYLNFLDRLAAPMAKRLQAGAVGLDFGCGPAPAMAVLLEQRGFRCASYDPLFANDQTLLARRYDFIACSETAEHFADPAREFARLDTLLKPGGLLGVMTQMRSDSQSLSNWRYARDPTHVALYRRQTLRWISNAFSWTAEELSDTVTLFRKRRAQ